MQDAGAGYQPAQQPYAPATLQQQPQQQYSQAPVYPQAPVYQQAYPQPAYMQPQVMYMQQPDSYGQVQPQQQQVIYQQPAIPYQQQQLQQPGLYSLPMQAQLQPQLQAMSGPQQTAYPFAAQHDSVQQPSQPPLQQDQLAALLAALQNAGPAQTPGQPETYPQQPGMSGNLDHLQPHMFQQQPQAGPGAGVEAQVADVDSPAGIRAYLQVNSQL